MNIKRFNIPSIKIFSMPELSSILPFRKIKDDVTNPRHRKDETHNIEKELYRLRVSEKTKKVIEELLQNKKVMIRSYNGDILIQLLSAIENISLFSEKFEHHVSTTKEFNIQTGQKDFVVSLTEKFDGVKIRKL